MNMDTKLLTIRTLISTLTSPSDQARLAALRHLHLMSNQDPAARSLISAAGAIPLLSDSLYSPSNSIQEHAAATLLNLSISDRHPLVSSLSLLDAFSHLLSRHSSSSSPSAVQSAAATLHSLLAVVPEYRPAVGGRNDLLRALVDLVASPGSSTRSVKDALKASFGVALHPPNRIVMIRLGAVQALFALLSEKKRKTGIVEDATAVIAQIAGCEESEEPFRKVSGIAILAGMLVTESGSCCSLRSKENAVSALLNLVRNGGRKVVREVRETVGALDGIMCVQEHGSAKGKSKAVALMKLLLDDDGSSSSDQVVEEDLYPVDSDSASA